MQRVDRLLPELGEPRGMTGGRSLGRQMLVFPCAGVRRAQLVELPPHVLMLALTTGPQLLEVAQRAAGLEPRRVRDRHRGALLQRRRVPVEQLGLRLAVEQRVMLMLAVERDQVAPALTQRLGGRGPSVDAGRASLAELALQHQRDAVRFERSFDRCLVGPMADLVGAAPCPQGQAERIDDQGLAAAGLAGEEVQARPETDARTRRPGPGRGPGAP